MTSTNQYGNRLTLPHRTPETTEQHAHNLSVIERWANSMVVNKIEAGTNVTLSSIPLAIGTGAQGSGIVTVNSSGGGGGGGGPLVIVNTMPWTAFSSSMSLGFTPTVGNFLVLLASGNGSGHQNGTLVTFPTITGVGWAPSVPGQYGNSWISQYGSAPVSANHYIGIVQGPSVGSTMTSISSYDTQMSLAVVECSGYINNATQMPQAFSGTSGTPTPVSYGVYVPALFITSLHVRGAPYGNITGSPTPAYWQPLLAQNDAIDPQGAAWYATRNQNQSLSFSTPVQTSGGGFTTTGVAILNAVP